MPTLKFGMPGAPKRGPGPKPIVFTPLPEDGAPEELQVMRHCNINPGKYDSTQAQKNMRKFLVKDPRGFQLQLAALEKDFRVNGGKKVSGVDRGSTGEEEGELDEGSEKVVKMIEGLLKEIVV